jgi:hypothetical protein
MHGAEDMIGMTEDTIEDMIKTGDMDMIKGMDMIENMTNVHKGNQGDNDKL